MLNKNKLENLSNEVWKGAIKLRGKFKAKDYPSVILPMIMIRRIECVLQEKREKYKSILIAKDPSSTPFSYLAAFTNCRSIGKSR